MSDEKKPADERTKHAKDYTEEDVAHQVNEDKNLANNGINPDGEPIEIMRQVSARLKHLKENPDAR